MIQKKISDALYCKCFFGITCFLIICHLSVSDSLWSEYRHPKWHQWVQAAGELHGGGGLPADPPHQRQDQQHQSRGFQVPQLPQADRHHGLPAAVSRLWPGQPQHALPKSECHPWAPALLQLRPRDLWDEQPEGHRPVQPEEHHPGSLEDWEEPGALLPWLGGLVSHYVWVQQHYQWK